VRTYTAIYLDYFGYSVADFIPCEVCNKEAKDIHHIFARSIRKDLVNDITNIMAVCRECHVKFGDQKQHREMLINKHQKKISER